MDSTFWSSMDALVAKTLNEDESYVDLEPPRTVKKVMNLVKHIATSDHDVRLKKNAFSTVPHEITHSPILHTGEGQAII